MLYIYIAVGTKVDSNRLIKDFNFHDHLYGADNHPERTETSGPVTQGDGLNTLANFGFGNFSRTKWDECSNVDSADCFTPKGFSAMTMEVETGVFVDFYNIHADARYNSPHLFRTLSTSYFQRNVKQCMEN